MLDLAKRKLRQKVEPRNCLYCGQNFKPLKNITKYCNRECFAKALSYQIDIEELQRLYNQGMSQEEIGVHFNISQVRVSKIMKRNNIKARIAAKRDQYGEKNHMWKGEEVSYKTAHDRVRNYRGAPDKCIKCGTTENLEWASINKNYTDIYDYMSMCVRCHRQHDMNLRNPRLTKECLECNSIFTALPSRGHQKFCSKNCVREAKRKQSE
jgi:ferredoxin